MRLALDARVAPPVIPSDVGTNVFVGRVFGNPTVPTSVGRFFSVHPVAAFGAEVEGGAGSLTVDTSRSVLVLVTGGRVPVAGDDLICVYCDNRWVAERLVPTAAGPATPCPSVPPVLTMTVNNPSLNGGMFQDDTIAYQAVPSGYAALHVADSSGKAYLGQSSFTDPFGDSFRYYFYWSATSYLLSRVYLHSSFGSPLKDSARYIWSFPAAGNSCSPFGLTNGSVYPGGDPASRVTISG